MTFNFDVPDLSGIGSFGFQNSLGITGELKCDRNNWKRFLELVEFVGKFLALFFKNLCIFCFTQWNILLLKNFVTAGSITVKHQFCVEFHDFYLIPNLYYMYLDTSYAFNHVRFQLPEIFNTMSF